MATRRKTLEDRETRIEFERVRDIGRMSDVNHWPSLVLPVKRRMLDGSIELGCMVDELGGGRTIVLCNLFEWNTKAKDAEKLHYASSELAVRDGCWWVD